jgi:putative tryptophan/tyrosine transport system substrate-binding protein
MRRREFLGVLGGAAAAWPSGARAQRPPRPVVGFLSTASPDESAHLVAAFRGGLAESGYAEGKNVTVEYQWALGQYDRLPALAAELARRQVAVLVATGGDPAPLAAKTVTSTIPVVGTFSSDPVERGLVGSLNRPGGNVTGVSTLASTLEPKRLTLVRELAPQTYIFGVLLNPNNPPAAIQLRDLEETARALVLQLHVTRASTDREIDAAFEFSTQHGTYRIAALVVADDPFFNSRRDKIVALAARHRVPAMYGLRDYSLAGGLMSYGVDHSDVYRQVGIYSGRILKGARPADLPVTQPTKFEFVINLKSAQALGLKLSDNLLSLADELIQ